MFYTKVHNKILAPVLNSPDQPPAPIELRRALKQIDRSLNGYIIEARLGTAA